MWRCRCVCGAEREVEQFNLLSGRSKSCRKCSAKVVGMGRRTHGLTKTKEYVAWQAMKTRCTNPNAKSWQYHGGAGVKVDPLFMDSFEAFLAEIGPAPTKLHTVDRRDPFGDYAPGNLRWATQTEQMRNTRKVRKRRGAGGWLAE